MKKPTICGTALLALFAILLGGCASLPSGSTFPDPSEAAPMDSTGSYEFSALSAQGHLIVNEMGEPVSLRGVNLGNWLLLEMWMQGIDHEIFDDQYTYIKTMEERFGEDEAARLMELYRSNWMTERDFEIIRSFGMNCLRLPIHYSIIEDDANPYQVRPGGWKWLDYTVEMAEKYGMYVILDLHGAAGGQTMDHISGRRGDNELWTNEENIKRTEWLWKAMAERYRDRDSVAAYDLLNEAWGTDNETLEKVAERLLKAVRSVDGDKLVILPEKWSDSSFYGVPSERGWSNVMFTAHFYPGFFGNGSPTVDTHVRFIQNDLPGRDQTQREVGVPLLIGEFQVGFKSAGGGEMMRRYFDTYNGYGWAATAWSYKVLKPEGGIGKSSWGMVVNEEPLDVPTPKDASKAELEEYYQSLSTMAYDIDEDLRYWMTTDKPLPPMPDPLPPRKKVGKAPHNDELPSGWYATDIGRSRPGGQRVISETEIDVYGAGNDIWANNDQFRFVWKKTQGDFSLSTQVVEQEDVHPYSKAGLMVRSSLDADAAQAVICVFPTGNMEIGRRSNTGDSMSAHSAGYGEFPNFYFRVRREGDQFYLDHAKVEGEWKESEPMEIPGIGDVAYVGLATLSHDNSDLGKASFRKIEFSGNTLEASAEDLEMGKPQDLPMDPLPGDWTATDVGDALQGGQKVVSENAITIYGAGADIWNEADQFRYVWQKVDGDFSLTATLNKLTAVHQYTKGGVMLRRSLEPESPMILLSVFPNGDLEFARRAETGGSATGGATAKSKVNGLRFRIERKGNQIMRTFAHAGEDWQPANVAEMEELEGPVYVGLVALSHDDSQHTIAEFTDIDLKVEE